MVRCDKCFKWWYYDCAGVSSDVKNVRWVCARCESGGTDEAAEARGHATSGRPNRAPRVTQSQEGEPSASCIKKTLQPSSSPLAPVTKYLTPTNKGKSKAQPSTLHWRSVTSLNIFPSSIFITVLSSRRLTSVHY